MDYSYFVGLDVGRKSFDASLMSLNEEELSHRSFANTESGIHSLLEWVNSYAGKGAGVLFCAENMGSYVTGLCLFSQQLHFHLALECSLAIKKSIGLQRGKNDRIDALRIASYAVLHHRKLKLYELPDKELVQLRNWMVIRNNLVKQKVCAMRLSEVTREAYALADLSEQAAFLQKQLSRIKEEISYVEGEMEKIINSSRALKENYALLTSIKGIGMINAIVLLCVTDNFRRFSDPRKFACYCGLLLLSTHQELLSGEKQEPPSWQTGM